MSQQSSEEDAGAALARALAQTSFPSLEEAIDLVVRAANAALGIGARGSFVVLDAGGWMICGARMDGAPPETFERARLEALGALTRGQRDAASGGVFNAEDNLETQWGALAVASLLKTIGQSGLEGLNYDQWLAQTGLALFDSEGNAKAAQIPITRFLNRVLCCDLGPGGGVQGLIMDALMEQLEHVIDAAKRDGKFDHGIQTIPALSLVKNAQEAIHTHEDSGATTSVVEITATVPREAKTYGQIHAMVARARERYGIEPIAVKPTLSLDEQAERYGTALWERDPDGCCALRKVAPQRAFLRDYDAWITGIRRTGSADVFRQPLRWSCCRCRAPPRIRRDARRRLSTAACPSISMRTEPSHPPPLLCALPVRTDNAHVAQRASPHAYRPL